MPINLMRKATQPEKPCLCPFKDQRKGKCRNQNYVAARGEECFFKKIPHAALVS